MRPISADVACLLVTHTGAPQKTAELIEMPFGDRVTCMVPKTMYCMWSRALYWKGRFGGCLAHWKALGVSAAVYTAKGIIRSSILACSWNCIMDQSSITARRAMRPFVKTAESSCHHHDDDISFSDCFSHSLVIEPWSMQHCAVFTK